VFKAGQAKGRLNTSPKFTKGRHSNINIVNNDIYYRGIYKQNVEQDKFPICVQSSDLFPLTYVSDAINFKDLFLRQLNELVSTGGEQNNGSTMKLRNVVCLFGYIETASIGNTECYCFVC
jgi:hypothetical protein